jgi:hypothetical protein
MMEESRPRFVAFVSAPLDLLSRRVPIPIIPVGAANADTTNEDTPGQLSRARSRRGRMLPARPGPGGLGQERSGFQGLLANGTQTPCLDPKCRRRKQLATSSLCANPREKWHGEENRTGLDRGGLEALLTERQVETEGRSLVSK